jgi:uncharacterized protein
MLTRPLRSFLLLAAVLACGTVSTAVAAEKELISIPRPGDKEFVLDEAELIKPSDLVKIKQLAAKLLQDKATPIVVVTINSMAEHGGAGMRIETFARLLFDQWGVGQAKINGQDWNTGILLLVSKGDRKARIELGAYWRRDHDRQTDAIMNEQIIPRFKQGDFSGGIVAGVEGLDKMGRGLALPQGATSGSASHGLPNWLIYAGIALAIFTVVSFARKGTGGWGWLFWGAVFGLIGTVLYQFLNNRSSGSGSGGGFSGGSFGGGFSGGGGSTGSW